VTITEPKYESTILQGIPNSLAVYAAQTLLTLRLTTKYTSKPIDMSDVIDSICKEADCVKMHRVLKEQTSGKGKKGGQTDEALIATSSTERCNNNNTKHCKGKCHHCQRDGHWVQECRTKKREEAAATASNQSSQTAQVTSGSSKPENKPVGSANAVFDNNSNSDGFCAAEEEEVIVHNICADPDLYFNDLDLDNDWDDVQAKVESTREQSDELESVGDGPDKLNNEGEDHDIEETAAAIITPANVDCTPCTEIYDLGASCHISLYKDNFTSYMPLSTLLYFNAASQHKFSAISMGTLIVQTPNRGRESTLALLHALYVPSITNTLISLRALDEEGYQTHIRNGCLHITSLHGDSIAEILRNMCHLYKVIHIPESTNAAKLVSAMELHCHLGHISIASAHKLI
jgi:hypothetical protein